MHKSLTASGFLVTLLIPLSCPDQTSTILPGQFWPDDKGEHINAHCGSIVKLGDMYY